MRILTRAILASLAAILAACDRAPPEPAPQPVTVFAAASTTDVLREASRRFETKRAVKVVFSFDSSSSLAKQIKLGSPADVFVSADEKWMDDVAAAGAIRPGTRHELLGNQLVMIAPAGKGFAVETTRDFDFASNLPQITRIAVGDPAHVPAGRYARQSLESLGWWSSLEPMLVPTQDVRAALRLVEMGEADAAIVYATDVANSEKVVVVARFAESLHDPIRYPVALCTNSPAAAEFVAFLRGAEMAEVFEHAGFRILKDSEGR